MKKGLDRLGVNRDCIVTADSRITPAYVKPWISEDGHIRELNRIDVKNWTPTPTELAGEVMSKLDERLGQIDAILVMDQMTEDECGLITGYAREHLADLARKTPGLIVYADSRSRISKFSDMIIKGNEYEIIRTAFGKDEPVDEYPDCMNKIRKASAILMERTHKPVITTLGGQGVWIFENGRDIRVPGIQLEGQLDVTGAGDTFSAAFVSALAAGADMETAGKIGNAAAAVCVTQIGTSGHVTAQQVIDKMT
jgi:sugar/nucleoside kinase (ribokinase family)